MGLFPIRVLLLPGGEPSFLSDIGQGGGYAANPLLKVETAAALPSPPDLESGPWQVCVLPCEAYLSGPILPPSLPAIVYGPSSLALDCLESGASDFMRPGWTWLELEARLFRFWSPTLAGDRGDYRLWGPRLIRLGELDSRDAGSGADAAGEVSVREASALRLLAYRPGRVVPYATLKGPERNGSAAGNPAVEGGSGAKSQAAVAMMMSRLRKKLNDLDPGLARRLQPARGLGYLWIGDPIQKR